MLDPHFHKVGSHEGQVSERDLLPDGSYIETVPDYEAPEGTEVTYFNGTTYRRYRMVGGQWRSAGAGGVSDLFGSFIDLVHWNSIDGFTAIKSTNSTCDARGSLLRLAITSGDGASANSGLYSSHPYYYVFEDGKQFTAEFIIHNLIGTTLGFRLYLFFITGPNVIPTLTNDHVGFQLEGSGSSAVIYASSADGTTQQKTDTTVTAAEADGIAHRLRLEYTRGSDCKFYVQDVLKATHTLNLPDDTNASLNIALASDGQAGDRTAFISRVIINKEY